MNASKEEILGIGIVSPGSVDSKNGKLLEASNLPGFKDTPVSKIMEEEFNIKTFFDNDANAAALGELWFGAGKDCDNFVYITVSTGIGGGIVINRNIYSGNTNNAGEIGHTTVEPNGPKCNCGNRGCLEVMASGTAIARIAKERLKTGEKSILSQYEVITSKEVFEAAAAKDRLAEGVIDYCMEYLGIGVANIVNTLDPEKIIIGGGVSKVGAVVFDWVRKVIDERAFKLPAKTIKIVPAGLGADAGVIGAVGIVLSNIKK
jgi:glucokinase